MSALTHPNFCVVLVRLGMELVVGRTLYARNESRARRAMGIALFDEDRCRRVAGAGSGIMFFSMAV